jgi:acyl CoA:acetate/3-ketoacid CoA transferase alpha subunit/acyl CoA:acetate/3-ketoacid CoA transferase beta subunit
MITMPKELGDIIGAALHPGRDGEGKLLGLDEAVGRYVRPRMKLHLAAGIGGPSAAICEIIRQYWGKTPEFTLIQSTLSGHALNLVHCNVVKKLICSVCADISASARPSKIIQEAYECKKIELENWSLYSLQQRLMAGALGVPFMPTKSVLGSSIASDNAESFREMEDPFGSEGKVGIVGALNPDISIIHGCVGDLEGNIILPSPYGEDLWGPLASRNGVLATVEKIVPTEFIRKYSALVKIPGYVVNAVCVAPLGLHPFSLPNPGISDFDPYEKDIDFLNDLHKASTNSHTLDGWIKEWVTDCTTHQHYLDKLGHGRIATLREKSKDLKSKILSASIPRSESRKEIDSEETMLIAVAREIVNSVHKLGHKLILAGAGTRGIAAWLAYYQLKAEGCEIELITGNGQIGYTPLPGESILSSEAGVRSSKMLTDTITTQGVFVGGKNNKCLSVLGAIQIDKYGNINSTMTSTRQFLMGSGGANDAMNAREVIVALDQSKDRFAEELPYITGRGKAVTTVVSTMGIFKKPSPQEELHLVACFPSAQPTSVREKVKEVQDRCGWPLKLASQIKEISKPSQGELDLLRWLLSSPSS